MNIREREEAYWKIADEIYDLIMNRIIRIDIDKETIYLKRKNDGSYSTSKQPYDYRKAISKIILTNFPSVSKEELKNATKVIHHFMLKYFLTVRDRYGKVIGFLMSDYNLAHYKIWRYTGRSYNAEYSLLKENNFNPKEFIVDILITFIEDYDWCNSPWVEGNIFVNGSNDEECIKTFEKLKTHIERKSDIKDLKAYKKFLKGLEHALETNIEPFKVPNYSLAENSPYDSFCPNEVPITNLSCTQWQKYFNDERFNGQISIGNMDQYTLLMAKICALLNNDREDGFKIICEDSNYFGNYSKSYSYYDHYSTSKSKELPKTGSGTLLGKKCDIVGGTRKLILVPDNYPLFSEGTKCVLAGGSFLHNNPKENAAYTFAETTLAAREKDVTPFAVVKCKGNQYIKTRFPLIDWKEYMYYEV